MRRIFCYAARCCGGNFAAPNQNDWIFGGLTVEETAEVVGISPATVKRDWTVARAWLYRELKRGHES